MPTLKYKKTLATDSLQNLIANIGTGTDRVSKSKFVPDNFFGNDELAGMYMGWLGRRIVDLVPDEALKKGWTVTCPSWTPDKIDILDAYVQQRLNLPQKINEALKGSRIFGGAVILAICDSRYGSFNNPIPDFLPKNSLLGIQMYDAWQCYPSLINFTNPLKKNYRNPESYTIGASGMFVHTYSQNEQGEAKDDFIQGTLVNWTRVERFEGSWLPWYARQRNLYWGQSVLSSSYEAVRNAKGVDASIASLLFRASVPVMKVQDLAGIIADPEAREAFLERVNLLNYGMSNNNMAIIDQEETLESFEPGAISNLDSILERYYILVSTATGIPVTKLIGESARGLNATGEGDLNNYYDMLEDYQKQVIKPALMDMYKKWIVPSLFDELIPKDFDITFPPLERVSPKDKQQSDSEFVNMLSQCLDAGLIDKKVARREIHERGVFNNFNQEDIDRIEGEEGDNQIEPQDAFDAADHIPTDDEIEELDNLDDMIEEEQNENIKLLLIVLRSKLREYGEEAAIQYIKNNDMLSEYFEMNGYGHGKE